MWATPLIKESIFGKQCELKALLMEEFVEISQIKDWVDPHPSPNFLLFEIEESLVAVFEDSGQVAPEVIGAVF